MKIRKPFLIMVIAVLLGMVTACEVPDVSGSTTGSTTGGGGTTYTVNFEANGGSPAPQKQTISNGGKITEPAPMIKSANYGFAGWYKEAAFNNLWNFDNNTVTGNTTLYAKWDSNCYAVFFVEYGGTPAPQPQIIAHGGKVVKPQNMSIEGAIFEGWYKEGAFINQWNFNSDTVTELTTLYAKWRYLAPPATVNVQGTTLSQKLQWVANNAASNTNYLLEVISDESLVAPQILQYDGKSNITIQLTGIGGVKTIVGNNSGSACFMIQGGVTLILNGNIVLKAPTNDANLSLVAVVGGNLIMNNGSKITGGGNVVSGVSVYNGIFTMNGGEISDNNFHGVTVGSGTFTMTGGKISDNSFSGVSVPGGTFTMNGGEISDNEGSYGGGVSVNNGTFTMNGGEISGNEASGKGGGVYVASGTFTMTGGEISDNSAIASSISSSFGGGVYVDSSSSFKKTGGIITGYSSDTVNGNWAKNSGHAVYVENTNSLFTRHKDTTAGQGDNLIYISNEPNPPTISGAWDN